MRVITALSASLWAAETMTFLVLEVSANVVEINQTVNPNTTSRSNVHRRSTRKKSRPM